MANVDINDHYTGWIKQSFMLPAGTLTAVDKYYRELTTAQFKFVDTRLGGNFCINNVPQYTQYADIRIPGRLTTNSASNTIHKPRGLGRFYSEQIDDNSQFVHMQFGVPAFNGMVTFFTGFYNNDAARLARTGTDTGAFYLLGKAAGFIVSIYAWPFIAAGHAIRFFSDAPASKYYYFKQTMVPYWNRVNSVVNTLAVNMGLVSRLYEFDESTSPAGENKQGSVGNKDITAADREVFRRIAPDIFHPSGAIDIYAVANRAQRLANRQLDTLEKLGNSNAKPSLEAGLTTFYTQKIADPGGRDIGKYTQDYHKSLLGSAKGPLNGPSTSMDVADIGAAPPAGSVVPNGATATWRPQPKNTSTGGEPAWVLASTLSDSTTTDAKRGLADNFVDNFFADMMDGSTHVTFRVDYTGTVEESFSNSVRESDISTTVNGISSSAASTRFSTSDGQTGVGFVDAATGALRDFVGGALDAINMSGLMALSGTAFVDFPKHWESSTATFSRSSYTIELRSPYGNTMSRFQNLYVPLSMLLAAALPLSTGKQSYTSPFILQLFCKGRNTIRLGMIDSLSITRGTGNCGWTNDGHPLGIDVSFSVVDLSTVLHMPIAPTYSLINPLDGVFDSDSNWNDYMATLSSLTLAEQIYKSRKIARALTTRLTQFQSNFSTAKWTNVLFNSQIGQFLNFAADAGQRTLGR